MSDIDVDIKMIKTSKINVHCCVAIQIKDRQLFQPRIKYVGIRQLFSDLTILQKIKELRQ